MDTAVLLFLFLVPFILSGISIVILPKLSKGDFDQQTALTFAAVGFVISVGIISLAFFLGKGHKTADTEIWNGRITAKTRIHDDYVESYSCNCSTDSKGQSKCSTCHRTHYTVKWAAQSTIGSFSIKSLDELDDDVYKSPDPAFYKTIRIGESCSKTHGYTNYIKAVPESLFHFDVKALEQQFKGMIPPYPMSVYSRWRIDRVLPVKIAVPNINEWNNKLADGLKDLGNRKQVNAVIVLANTPDEMYAYALQSAWLNGKKNDVVLIIGSTEFPKQAQWTKVLAFSKNELFAVKLEDDIRALETLEVDTVLAALTSNIDKYYERKPMADYAYLDAENYPPNWVIVTTLLVVIFAYLTFWFVTYKDLGPSIGRKKYGARRRY